MARNTLTTRVSLTALALAALVKLLLLIQSLNNRLETGLHLFCDLTRVPDLLQHGCGKQLDGGCLARQRIHPGQHQQPAECE